jgi:hypothetical protein
MAEKTAKPPDKPFLLPELIGFWNLLAVNDELGGTTRAELESIQNEVTDCLSQNPPDVLRANRLTVDAMTLLSFGKAN